MSRRLFCIVIAFTCFFQPVLSNYTLNIQLLSRKDGLSNSAVNAIAQDAEGYIWIGTWDGLNRYDGSSFENFKPGGLFGIHNNVIRRIFPSGNGCIWMLTNNGISLYNNRLNRFYSFFASDPDIGNYEDDVTLEHADSQGTYAGIYGQGIFIYSEKNQNFIKVSFRKNGNRQASLIKRLFFVSEKLFFINSENSLIQVTGDSLVFICKLPIQNAITTTLGFTYSGSPFLLITQRNSNAILIDIDRKSTSNLEIPNQIISASSVSLDRNFLWLGTEQGIIYRYFLSDKRYEPLILNTSLLIRNKISARIICFREIKPDILWAGTDGNGVIKIKLTVQPVETIPSRLLSYPIVRSILITRNRDMLVGTKGGGIDIFDSTGRFKRNISSKNGLSNNSVLSFHQRYDGSIWVGTDGEGVDILSEDYRRITNFPRDYSKRNPIRFASVYRIFEDDDHNIFIGTSGFGVIMLRFQYPKPDLKYPISFEQVKLDESGSKNLQKQIVYAMDSEKPGIIWIGTRGQGIYRYNTITKRVLIHLSTANYSPWIKNNDVLAVRTGPDHSVWIGTSGGIYAVTPVSDDSCLVKSFTMQEGLSNNSVHSILFDNQNNLWFSTNLGLSCIDHKTHLIKNFNPNDGLINYEYSDGASYYDPVTSFIYFGGTEGIDIMNPSQIKFSNVFPPIAINELFVNNKPVDIPDDGILQSRINLQQKLSLKYNQNAISFFVTPLDYWNKERYKIVYRLEKFNDKWIVNPPNQFISYTNLSPGKYYFRLRVSDENGIWSPVAKSIEITIHSPWWLTGWAIGFYVLFTMVVLLAIMAFLRKKTMTKKERALREMKQKQEEELHQHKIEFFTNVAHEFRTPLTVITAYIQNILNEDNIIDKTKIRRVYKNSLKLQKLVQEIILFRKLEMGKESVTVKATNPTKLLEEIITDVEILAQNKGIQIHVTSDDPEKIIYTDPEKLQRIFSNLISNAIKYNKCNGSIFTSISFPGDQLITTVKDTGNGIGKEAIDKIFEPFGLTSGDKKASMPNVQSTGIGLAVTKGLVKLLGGSISVESDVGSGTSFTVSVPSLDYKETPAEAEIDEHEKDTKDLIVLQDETEPDFNKDSLKNANSKEPVLLIVDDDKEILFLLRDLLGEDYVLRFASDGKNAWEILQQEHIDLVISDIMMPGMDGIELCKNIRKNFDTSHLPLILLTAKAEIEDRIKGLEVGADSYIPKPFHPDHLRIRIEKLLEIRKKIQNRFQESSSLKEPQVPEIHDPFFQKILHYIETNLDDVNLNADNLCDFLAVSKSSLYNKTKVIAGTTPHGLINRERIRKAATLLRSTNLTVSEIIYHTGFNSRPYFYDIFNKTFGCSPTEYREKNSEPPSQ